MAITVLTDGSTAQNQRTLTWTIPTLATGDVVVVSAVTWDQSNTLNDPSGTGLSFGSPLVAANASTRCRVYLWAATASSGGTNVVVTCSVLAATNSIHTGTCLVLPTADGYSLAGTPNVLAIGSVTAGAAAQGSLSGASGNLGIVAAGDWNGVSGASRAWLNSATEDLYAFDSTNSTQYFSHCTLTGASTTVGLSAPTTGTWNAVGAIEVLLSAGTTVEGVATAAFGGTFTASGVPETFGAAAASLGFTGTALGQIAAVQGQASATFGGTFTALGEIVVPPVTYVSQGAAVAGSTSITTAAYGTGWAEGDLGVCVVASNHATVEATEPTVDGFTNVGTLNGGGGSQGAGAGNRRLTFFTRELLSADDTTPTISLSTGNVMVAAITIFRKDPALSWATAVAAFGAETTAGTSWSEAMTTNPVLDAEDMALLACAVRDDTATSSAEGITATGATFGTVTERVDSVSATGNDIALHVNTCDVLTGPSSAAPVCTATHATSETGVMGVLRIRAVTAGVSGVATAAFGGTFTAAGVPETFGAAAASLGGTFAAAGVDRALGVAAAAFGGTFTASGQTVVVVQGQASASFGGTFTAQGVDQALGQALAAFGFTGSAQGIDRALGVALASLGFTGSAQGVARALGAALASLGFTASAAGVRGTQGTASASFGFTATASGTVGATPITGVATASFGFTATSSGTTTVRGASAATFGYTGSAAGVDRAVGVAAASFAFTGTAAGIDQALGVAAAAFGFTGTALGNVATPAVAGVAVAALGFTGTAAGRPRVLAVLVATFGFNGTAIGINLSIVVPPERTTVVPAENRVTTVEPENRLIVVPAENRMMEA